MIQYSNTIKQLFFCFLLCFYFQSNSLSAQVLNDTVILNTEIIPGSTDEDVTINIIAEKFTNLASFQFELIWDNSILTYQSVENFGIEDLDEMSFGFGGNTQEDRSLKILWISSDFINGTSLEEGELLFSINFKRRSFIPHNVAFWGGNFSERFLSPEFLSADLEFLSFQSDNTDILTPNHIINGIAFIDENKDCIHQESEQGISNLFIQFNDRNITYSATTDSLGMYQIKVQPGNYVIKDAAPFNDFWTLCNVQDTTKVSFDIAGSSNQRDLPVSIERDCPALSVNVSNGRLRRCFDELYVSDLSIKVHKQ